MLLAENTGCVSGPGQTPVSFKVARSGFDGPVDFLFSGYFCNGPCGADAPAQRTGGLATALRHDEAGCPDPRRQTPLFANHHFYESFGLQKPNPARAGPPEFPFDNFQIQEPRYLRIPFVNPFCPGKKSIFYLRILSFKVKR